MRRWLLLLPFLLFPPPLSLAADEDDADTHVVVTATRLDDRPAPVAELPASVTVLDREQSGGHQATRTNQGGTS